MAGLRGVEPLGGALGLTLDGALPWRVLAGRHLLVVYLALLLAIVWLAPNSHQILGQFSPALARPQEARPAWMRWRPNAAWLAATLAVLFLCLANLHRETRFLYFQF
ncbi:hypothetical protein [Paracidovorax cattleyae]|nr:hypothetical protein [Paracidovorax cattleyae]